jgi:hypothetical protein
LRLTVLTPISFHSASFLAEGWAFLPSSSTRLASEISIALAGWSEPTGAKRIAQSTAPTLIAAPPSRNASTDTFVNLVRAPAARYRPHEGIPKSAST